MQSDETYNKVTGNAQEEYNGDAGHDQALFDAHVNKYGKTVLEALAGIGIFAALLMSIIALASSGAGPVRAATVETAAPKIAAVTPAPVVAPADIKTISLKVGPEWKLGPEGKKHDAFSVTNFTVKVGQPVRLKIDNFDEVPHSITSAEAGVNIVAQPGTHIYTLVVKTAGKFIWHCSFPCDPWSMNHEGYMMGTITAE